MEDVLRLHEVQQVGGALELKLGSLDGLMPGIVRLGQAAVRVADLTFTRRNSLQTSMTEELEEFLSDSDLEL